MSPSSGIIVGTVVLALFVLSGGYLVVRTRRARRRGSSWASGEPAGRRRASARHFGSEQIHLGERIESWTRQPAAATPSTIPPSTVPQVSTLDEPQPPLESPPALPSSPELLIAPVELWFGSTRVGVVRGSATHEEFERYASVLLSELPKR